VGLQPLLPRSVKANLGWQPLSLYQSLYQSL
jgi:hypothetical protein